MLNKAQGIGLLLAVLRRYICWLTGRGRGVEVDDCGTDDIQCENAKAENA